MKLKNPTDLAPSIGVGVFILIYAFKNCCLTSD